VPADPVIRHLPTVTFPVASFCNFSRRLTLHLKTGQNQKFPVKTGPLRSKSARHSPPFRPDCAPHWLRFGFVFSARTIGPPACAAGLSRRSEAEADCQSSLCVSSVFIAVDHRPVAKLFFYFFGPDSLNIIGYR
jgi:hypothetical protein